jgi:hypothetical protein
LVSTPAGKIRSLTRRKEREVIALDAIVEGKFQNGHAGANNLQKVSRCRPPDKCKGGFRYCSRRRGGSCCKCFLTTPSNDLTHEAMPPTRQDQSMSTPASAVFSANAICSATLPRLMLAGAR